MEDNTLTHLKSSIQKLQSDRDGLTGELLKDRQNLVELEKQLNNLRMEFEYQTSVVREKEGVLNDYNKMIDESEKAYQKLIENSSKLLKALENETNLLRGKIKGNLK